ncbi:Bacterial membrane flanked domain protein [compost metagenome]
MAASEEVVLWEGKPSGLTDRIKNVAFLNNTHYTITSQRVIVKSGLLTKKTEEVEMYMVKDISIEQSVSDRLLGVGSINIVSSDENTPKLILDDVQDVEVVKDLIRNAVREEKALHNISYRDHV